MRLSRRTLWLAAALLPWLGRGFAGAQEEVPAKVDEYMEAGARLGRFSSAVLVARGGTVLVSRGYGVANREEDAPIMPYTRFRIASVTKQFTALAILLLQERGELRVGDPVCEHVPDCPPAWEEITLHHLLTHTAGVPDWTRAPDRERIHRLPATVPEILARFRDLPLDFEPGESFAYSNSGYALLGAVIERVSGLTYAEFLRRNVFEPLEMRSTGYDDGRAILRHRAQGYARQGDGPVHAGFVDMSNPYAAGGLYSTVEDLYRWSRALTAPGLVSQATLEAMLTPCRNHYAYGLVVDEEFGRKRISHSGAIEGFTSSLALYPEEGAAVIVLSNLDGAPSAVIGHDLAAILFGEPYEVPAEHQAIELEPRITDAYVGEYEREPGRNFRVFKEDGRLFLAYPTRPTTELFAMAETEFFVKVVNVTFTFVKDAQGRVTHLVLHQLGQDIPAKRVE